MWQTVKLDAASGVWKELGRSVNLAECKSFATDAPANTYHFWASPPPSDHAEQERIIEQVLAANDGRILRVGIGVTVSVTKAEALSGCPGNCFCVVANGSRRCETQYCNENWCWWVSCGMSC